MILEDMYKKKATLILALTGFVLCGFDAAAQQQSAPEPEQPKAVEDDRGVTKLPPLTEEASKEQTAAQNSVPAAATSAPNGEQQASVQNSAPAAAATSAPNVEQQAAAQNVSTAPPVASSDAAKSTVGHRKRFKNAANAGEIKDAANAGERRSKRTKNGEVINQAARSGGANVRNRHTPPTVVNTNGHVEKIGNLADLELDRWYFFASPATLQKIIKAQKDGNVPPAITDNAPVKDSAESAPPDQQASASAQNTEKPAEENVAEPALSAQQNSAPVQEKIESKSTYADITIDVKGNKVNAVDDKGNKIQFSPTVTENNMVLMNGDKSIAVINEDGTHVKTVPSNWEPTAPLNETSKPEEKPIAPGPDTQQKEEPKSENEPASPEEEPKSVESEESKTPGIQILEEPLDLAKGVPEGFIPKNAVGVILAG
jgi:hypothetical protein